METRISGICNFYGVLTVKDEEGKYFWSIEDWSGQSWEEIPKTLYDELLKFEAEGLNHE